MDYNKELIVATIDDILLTSQLSLEITRLFLNYIFVSWNKPNNEIGEKDIRKFLIVDFYQILIGKQTEYIGDLKDYSKNADEHLLLQDKIKSIANLCLKLQKKEYHDEIIYLMNILS